MRILILIHRWLGIAFCLFFAMWFASGIVMHFVPFPSLTQSERSAGLTPLAFNGALQSPADAVRASGRQDIARIRLIERPDGPVYVMHAPDGLHARHAITLVPATVSDAAAAVAIASTHARNRRLGGFGGFGGLDPAAATYAELALHDQWSVPNNLDMHRPLHRIALNDDAGTELYVSSVTGEVVRDTTRQERFWNYLGSVVHWIYPTVLRRDHGAWHVTVWVLSLAALIGALTGTVLGVLRTQVVHGRLTSPYRGWMAWHHWLGLGTTLFVLTWIFSGWLSMDQGLLFSNGRPSVAEAAHSAGTPPWPQSTPAHGHGPAPREIEWFGFDGEMMRRELIDPAAQRLTPTGAEATASSTLLSAEAATRAGRRLAENCGPAAAIPAGDGHPASSVMAGAPVYRIVCGDTWFHIDSANGTLMKKLDPSARAYRWAYGALHTLDFPALSAHPALRTWLIVLLSLAGLAFSLTGTVIGWRRLR